MSLLFKQVAGRQIRSFDVTFGHLTCISRSKRSRFLNGIPARESALRSCELVDCVTSIMRRPAHVFHQ